MNYDERESAARALGGCVHFVLCTLTPAVIIGWIFALLPDSEWNSLFPSEGSVFAVFLLLASITSEILNRSKKIETFTYIFMLICILWYVLARIPNNIFQINGLFEMILIGAWR